MSGTIEIFSSIKCNSLTVIYDVIFLSVDNLRSVSTCSGVVVTSVPLLAFLTASRGRFPNS